MTMTTAQAMSIINQVAAAFIGNQQDHKLVAEAVAHISAIVAADKQDAPQ